MSDYSNCNFDVAKNALIPFGKFRGLTLNQAATDDEGLLYLADWMAFLPDLQEPFRTSLYTFVGDIRVAADVERLHEIRKTGRTVKKSTEKLLKQQKQEVLPQVAEHDVLDDEDSIPF